jgi:hypothetical protein
MRSDAKKLFKIGLIVILFLFILIYAFIRSKGLIFGVKIKDVNLTNGATVTEDIINLTGNAKNAINLTLNDREISINQAGNFNETISLLPGYNTITLKAKDKFGNSDEENYQLIYKQEIPAPISVPVSTQTETELEIQ